LNPVIKFTTLFGLLAVELAVTLTREQGAIFTNILALVFFAVSFFFVYRSFYSMRIRTGKLEQAAELRERQETHVA